MRLWLTIWCLLIAGIGCISQSERTSAFWQSRDSNYNQDIVSSGGGYNGPGDVVASAQAWYGLRAYSAADRGNKLLNVCNVSDITCADLSSDATTGNLTVGTIGGSSCSVVACTIKTFYDRSGNGIDVTQATIGNRATLTANAIGSFWGAVWPTAGGYDSSSNAVCSSPYTFSFVYKTQNFSGSFQIVATDTDRGVNYFEGTPQFTMYDGTDSLAAATGVTTNAFHAMQAIFNTGSSAGVVDTSVTTGTMAGNAINNPIHLGWRGDQSAPNNAGTFQEVGLWCAAFNATQYGNMNTNQHNYWGF